MDDDIDRKRFYMSSTGPERKFELDRAELRRESETCLRLNEYYSYKPDDAGFMGIRYMDPDKLRAMADAEDAAGCTSVGGLAADLGQPIHGPDRRLEEKEKITGDLCAICGIGFLLPSLRCDHCNQKGGDAMSRDFEDGPPLSRKARTMERLDQETLQELRTQYSWRKLPNGAEVQGDAPGGVVIMLLDSLEAAETELVTERAMHSAALERADALGDKLQQSEAAAAAASETIFVLAKALRAAAYELNAIRARDGVPWTSSGYASGVSENYFSDVVENCFSALDSAGYQYVPWAFKEIQPLPAGRELLAELTAYREWVPRAVEAKAGCPAVTDEVVEELAKAYHEAYWNHSHDFLFATASDKKDQRAGIRAVLDRAASLGLMGGEASRGSASLQPATLTEEEALVIDDAMSAGAAKPKPTPSPPASGPVVLTGGEETELAMRLSEICGFSRAKFDKPDDAHEWYAAWIGRANEFIAAYHAILAARTTAADGPCEACSEPKETPAPTP